MIHVFIRPLSGRERSRCLRHVAVRVNARRAQPRRTSTIDEDARARGAGEHAARVFRVRGGARARERRTRRSRVARYVALDRRTSRERDGVRGELAGQRAELREPRIRDANHVVRARESAGSRRGGVEQAARAVHGRERCAACPRWIALAKGPLSERRPPRARGGRDAHDALIFRVCSRVESSATSRADASSRPVDQTRATRARALGRAVLASSRAIVDPRSSPARAFTKKTPRPRRSNASVSSGSAPSGVSPLRRARVACVTERPHSAVKDDARVSLRASSLARRRGDPPSVRGR